MRIGSGLDKFASVLLVICVGIVVSGTKACQTDYEVGVQSKVPTATVTPTGTVQPTGTVVESPTGTPSGNETGTPSGDDTDTPEATATAVATRTGAATATPNATPTAQAAAGGGGDLFNELSMLDGDDQVAAKAPAAVAGGAGSVIQPGNWLGEAFSKEDDNSWQDSDGDGFSDSLEEEFGTDLNSAGSAPRGALSTRLAARVGPEAIGDDAPRESDDVVDSDNDGVSDETEEQRGMNPRSMDSDADGLPDNKELAFGSNPLQIDSDGDGISDGREFDFGADPTVAEPRRGGE